MNLRSWLSFILFIGMVSLVSAGCTSNPRVLKNISQPNSDILGKLIQTSDLKDGWNWLSEITEQNQETPTSENHQMLEKASRSLSGFYLEKYYITIRHTIEKYGTTSNIPAGDKINTSEFNTFYIEFTKFVLDQVSNCRVEPESQSKICDIESTYNTSLSKVTIIFPIEIDDVMIVQVSNLVLNKIDVRMKP